MNEFLEQFLIESRELVAQASDDLLALERTPGDIARLDRVFRAFHTLKGAAGIVEFDAMTRLMHLAEDALATKRTGKEPATKALIDRSIECLDLVGRWLEVIERTEDLPTDADREARQLVAGLSIGQKAEAPPASERVPAGVTPETGALAESDLTWFVEIFANHNEVARAKIALRYIPDQASFFAGEDPVDFMRQLPGLCALDIRPRSDWPSIDDLDPFSCNLIIYALSSDASQAVDDYLAPLGVQIEIKHLRDITQQAPREDTARLIKLISAQIDLLANTASEGLAGRIGSAGRTARNIFSYLGNPEKAREIDIATAESLRLNDARLLREQLTAALSLIASSQPTSHPADGAQSSLHHETSTSLRVDVRRIDAIVKLTGELTVVKNAIGHLTNLAKGGSDPQPIAQSLREQHVLLERLTDELQRSVLAIRVLPLRQVFQRFPRVLRDIAGKLGKEVQLVTEGDATEADKVIVEGLFEPLLHVLRNAVDHGIEPANERLVASKSPIAAIQLRGYRAGENVIIDVTDDGRGIDADIIRRIALAKQLMAPEMLAAMTDDEILEIIFMPGFSGAQQVTDLSGRGVGLDAVRTSIQQLGGLVTVHTQRQLGTTFRFTLPFSVMMTRIMTVEAGGQVFGLPFDAMVEMAQIPRHAITSVGASQAIVFRDQTIPLINLPITLGRDRVGEVSTMAKVVIARVGGHLGALEVDRFGERMDLMLSRRDGLLAEMRGVGGTTLLGDGRVLIVLDLQELLQ